MTETWITWVSRYDKKKIGSAHRVLGIFDPEAQLRLKCGKRVAGQRATRAKAGVPRCRVCYPH